ncbi:nitroreductase family protein [Nocardioides sp.]|uniref:nitroreductase family protein n=1 Tax=Nocardioides sp. TaxID=35761 RepID=UPI00261C2FE7|nr:nitroreductase family protein [Nocardioides sp.]
MWFRRAKAQQYEETALEKLVAEFALDAERFHQHSIPDGGAERYSQMSGMQLDASATRLYHRVEKGFSLPTPRRPFGARAIPGLNRVLASEHADLDALYAREARLILEALAQWNDHGDLNDQVAPPGESLPTNPLDPETLATFITSRHSVRDFDQRPVDRALISEAVRLGGYAPSVCNRQGWRAYWFDDREDIARILADHRGSAGFADRVPGLFVITYDLRAFEETRERNQGWIDAGLFSMTLLLALHGLGLGAVPLNWSRRNSASRRIRRNAALPEHENVVMLIAAGHPAPGYRVARSARRPVSEILRFGMPSA